MKEKSEPTVQEWQELQLIASHVESIVSDSDFPVSGTFAPGLLDMMTPESEPAPTISKTSRLRHSIVNPWPFPISPEQEVLDVLPDIDLIGHSRAERLANLVIRLKEIKAYAWLSNHPDYSLALKTLARLGKTNQDYAKDTAEFILLGSIIFPLKVLLVQRRLNVKPPYPTKAELETAYRQARALSRFLKEKTPIFRIVDVPPRFEADLVRFESELGRKRHEYRKPPSDDSLTARDFRDQVIQNLLEGFGACSATLVSHILTLVEFSHDKRDLQRQIGTLRQTRARAA